MSNGIPGTAVNTVERCSGHDGTYGVKREFFANSMKIGMPVFRRMAETEPDFVCSDCPALDLVCAGPRLRNAARPPALVG